MVIYSKWDFSSLRFEIGAFVSARIGVGVASIDVVEASEEVGLWRTVWEQGRTFAMIALWGQMDWRSLEMALLHVLFHYISMANLISYHVHSLLYEDRLFARGLIGAGVELALLGRFANELWSNKIGVDDYMHHFAHLIGVGLVLYREDCRSYLYLLTRMNVLHFPCFVYYFACRKNGASFVNTYVFNRRYAHHIMDFARVIFPCLWISAVAYRSGSMVVAAYTAYRSEDGLSTAFVSLVLLASCLTYLDFSWSKYFFEEVGFSQHVV